MNDDLVRAAFAGDVETVGCLLDAGADIDRDGQIWNPLHAAIENGKVACVQMLIRRGADIEHRAEGNLSPLAHAVDIAIDGAAQKRVPPGDETIALKIINSLLEAGSDPASGLAVARQYQSAEIVALLTSATRRRRT